MTIKNFKFKVPINDDDVDGDDNVMMAMVTSSMKVMTVHINNNSQWLDGISREYFIYLFLFFLFSRFAYKAGVA